LQAKQNLRLHGAAVGGAVGGFDDTARSDEGVRETDIANVTARHYYRTTVRRPLAGSRKESIAARRSLGQFEISVSK